MTATATRAWFLELKSLGEIHPNHLEFVLVLAEVSREISRVHGGHDRELAPEDWRRMRDEVAAALQRVSPDVRIAFPLLQSILDEMPWGWTADDVLNALKARGPAAALALPLLYRNAYSIREVRAAIRSIDTCPPKFRRFKLLALSLMFHPTMGAEEVARMLFDENKNKGFCKWLSRQLVPVARALTRVRHDEATCLVSDFLGDLYGKIARNKNLGFDLRKHGSFLAFFKEILRHDLVNEWRKEQRHLRRRAPGDALDRVPETRDDDRERTVAETRQKLLAFVCTRLPERQRQAVLCRYLLDEQLSREDAAKELGISVATLDKDITAARQAISRHFDGEDLL